MTQQVYKTKIEDMIGIDTKTMFQIADCCKPRRLDRKLIYKVFLSFYEIGILTIWC